jgi:hypothetical protein
VEASVECFRTSRSENANVFNHLVRIIATLQYDGYVVSPKNNYQVNLTFDQRIVEQMHSRQCECTIEPILNSSQELAQAVGRKADLLIRVPETNERIIVEIEKANKEKILRDIV